MAKNFRYVMLVVAILAAIATPTPDARAMLIFVASMVALYFLAVVVTKYRHTKHPQ